MPTVRESLCCQEIYEVMETINEVAVDGAVPLCITVHEGFESVCLNRWVLRTAAYQTRQQYGSESTDGPPHKFVGLSY